MRAVTSATHSASPTDNFVRVLDQFAALSSYSSDATAVGGYRVLSSQRALQHQTYRTSLPALSVAARTGARVRWTGSLSVLFIGGLVSRCLPARRIARARAPTPSPNNPRCSVSATWRTRA